MKKHIFMAAAMLSAVSAGRAASLTWDSSGTNAAAPVGGSGTWDTSSALWSNGSADVVWSNANNDTAVFGGATASTVTLDAGGITAGGLSFTGNTTYTLAGGPLTLSGSAPTITLTNATFASNAVISSVINTTGALNIASTSAGYYVGLTLNGVNSISGGVNVNGNAISLTAGNGSALGSGALTVNGTYFGLNGNATLANDIALGASSSGGTTAMTVNSGTLRLNGIISGTGKGLAKSGTNELTLAGANTYTGGTLLGGGTLRVATSDAALGTGALTVTTATTNGSITNTLATQSGGGARTLANAIAITNNGTGVTTLAVDGGYANLTLNGVISGNGALSKVSSGTVILGGNNTYSGGTSVASGTLNITNASALGTGTATLASGTTLSVSTGGTIANAITGAGAVSSVNGGFTLSGANTYTGITYVGANTLTLTNGFAVNLQSTSQLQLGYSSGYTATVVSNASGADTSATSLLLRGNGAVTFNGTGSLVMSGAAVTGNAVDANAKLLTFNGTGANASYSGLIGGGNGGALNVAKSGTGTWTLSGANTYAGTTAISAGRLIAANANALGSGSAVTVSGSGALQVASGVTLTSVAALVVNSGATLSFGSSASGITLASGTYNLASGSFLDVGAFSSAGTYNLITGASGVGTAASSFTNQVAGYNYQLNAGANGVNLVVTAVPEPSAYGLLGAGALAGVAFVRRRRKQA